MLPWIMLGASLLQNAQKKKDARKDALGELYMTRAQQLGANTMPLQAMQRSREIERQPMVDPGLLANAIGSTVASDSIDDRLAKEMARRGLMKGYLPFDDQSRDPEGDLAAAIRARDTRFGGY